MEYILKNFSLNQNYHIDENALHDVVKNIINETNNNIKISTYEIKMFPDKNMFKLYVSLWTKKGGDAIMIIKEFSKLIDSKFIFIFNIKPNNVLIDIKGEF